MRRELLSLPLGQAYELFLFRYFAATAGHTEGDDGCKQAPPSPSRLSRGRLWGPNHFLQTAAYLMELPEL